MSTFTKSFLVGLAGATMLATAANAGGLERSGYNIDGLFDESRFSMSSSVTYVMPNRTLTNVQDLNAANGVGADGLGGGETSVRETESYLAPRFGIKAGFGDMVDCYGDYAQAWGGHTNPGADWVGANSNIETKIDSNTFSGTCSAKFDVGPGKFRIIGGVSHHQISGFKTRLVGPAISPLIVGSGIGRLDLAGEGNSWRIGAAYEIPEIALRASLVYNSETRLDNITGSLDLTQVDGSFIPVFGSSALPESVELKVQSGVAPNWLVFGSVKWVDWSQLQTVAFCPEATRGIACVSGGPTEATSLELFYRDGWTVSGGVGHKISDLVSAAASLTWDRGTGTGTSSQSDTWTLGLGASITPNENTEFRVGGAIGILTAGSLADSDLSADFGTDIVTALSASFKAKF